ncbi:hypothetical protein N2152v2_007586 [Parachlorella kessleri]
MAATVELLHRVNGKRHDPIFLGDLQSRDRDIASFEGYRSTLPRRILYYAAGVASAGLLFLVAHWFLDAKLRLLLSRCSLREAHYVVVTLVDGARELVPVQRLPGFSGINIQAAAATHVLSEEDAAEDEQEQHNLKGSGGGSSSSGLDRLLECRCGRYLYSEGLDTFLPVPGLAPGFAGKLHRLASRRISGQLLDDWDRTDYRQLYGSNELRVPVRSFFELLLVEMVHPFYVFQYASVTIWCLQQYYSYSFIILGITLFSILSTVVSTYSYRRRLAALAHYVCEVRLLQSGREVTVPSTELVPGDVVVVTPGILPCDVVLVRGECIVDENMLTGEAVPVRKVSYNPAVDGASYSPDVHKGCTLYGGTSVAQVRPGGAERQTLGVVCRTSFWTAKGELLKSILHPRVQHKLTFVSDALKFIGVMLLLGLLFYIWDVIALASYGAKAGFIILKYLDLITVAVPPALPACLTVATTIAISRLAKHDIFVSNPTAITAAGHLNIICFDKTGTLTEPGLALKGVVLAEEEGHKLGDLLEVADIPEGVLEMLATCHGLALLGHELVGDPLDQRLFEATGWSMLDDGAGQAVEVLTVSEDHDIPAGGSPTSFPSSPQSPSTPCVLATAHVCTRVQPPAADMGEGPAGDYTIIRRFEFSAEKQRNVVVVRKPDATLWVYAKGSPEMICRLAGADSVPADFDGELARYTKEGLRVLGLAARQLQVAREADVQALSQEELEQGLRFVGLTLLVNALRPDTSAVIGQLHVAGIRTVMVTGDHARTGASVAAQCGMLCQNRAVCMVDTAVSEGRVADTQLSLSVVAPDGGGAPAPEGEAAQVLGQVATGALQAAVTGRGFEKLVEDSEAGGLDTVLHRAGVFARMSPDDKRLLVELLGEGAFAEDGSQLPGLGNFVGFCGDGANDVGALKAAHVGVSLCEAEASVAAPLTSRRQTIACMLTVVAEGRCSLSTSYLIFKYIIVYAFIQVFAVNLMYSFGGSVGNFQYLIQDLLYTTVIASAMGFTRPASRLAKERPPDRLMSLGIWLPVICQFATCAVFQVLALVMLSQQPFYVRFDPHPSDGTSCFTAGQANSPRCSQSWENSVAFLMALGQFLITAFVFNKGPPHRKPLHTNKGLLVALLLQTGFLVYLIFSPGGNAVTHDIVGLVPFPAEFRTRLFVLLVLNLGASWLVDWFSHLLWRAVKEQLGSEDGNPLHEASSGGCSREEVETHLAAGALAELGADALIRNFKGKTPRMQPGLSAEVPGCGVELVHAKCGRFHTLERFDGEKKSCRERLQWHNERRRLAQARTSLRAGGKARSQAPLLEDSAQEEDEVISATLTASTVPPPSPSDSDSETSSEMRRPLPAEPESSSPASPATSHQQGSVKEEPAPANASPGQTPPAGSAYQRGFPTDGDVSPCPERRPGLRKPSDDPAGDLLPPNPIWRTDTGESSNTQLLVEESEQLQNPHQQHCRQAAWQELEPPVVSLPFQGLRCASPTLSAIASLDDLEWLLPATGAADDSQQECSHQERGFGAVSPLLVDMQRPGAVGGVNGPWQDLFADQLPKLGPWRAQPSSAGWAAGSAGEGGLKASADEQEPGSSESVDEMDAEVDEEPAVVVVQHGCLPPGSLTEVLAMDIDAALGLLGTVAAVKGESLPAHNSPVVEGAEKQAHAPSGLSAQLSAVLPSGDCMAGVALATHTAQQSSPCPGPQPPAGGEQVGAVCTPATPQQLVTKRLPLIKTRAEPPASGQGCGPAGGGRALQPAATPGPAPRPTFTASAFSYVAAAAAAEAAARQREVATATGRHAVPVRATDSGVSLLPGTPLNLLPTPQRQPLPAAAGAATLCAATPRFFMDSGGSIKLGLPGSGGDPASGQQGRTVPLPVLITGTGPEVCKASAAGPLVQATAPALKVGLAGAAGGLEARCGEAQGVTAGPATSLAGQVGVAKMAAGAPVYSGKPVQR